MINAKTNTRSDSNATGAKTDNIKMDKGNDFFPNIPIIPHNSDLEKPPAMLDEIFNSLPRLLKEPCDKLMEQAEKEVFLVGALGVISGILPKVQGLYDGSFCYPNLFVYILGQYGTGKGALKYVRKIGDKIHDKKKELSMQLQSKWKEECIQAKANSEPEPEHTGNKFLFIPADNSKSGFVELLSSNDCFGILYETEGDTLADAIKTDWGGFSDVLRKVFHHEPISFYRKTGREMRELNNARLSVLLTSTPDQYRKLVPNIHNGLFSRFLHYHLTPNHEFKNVFDERKKGYTEYFDNLGCIYEEIFTKLEGLKEPIVFEFQEHQKGEFVQLFSTWKKEIGEYVSTDLDGTVNRLGFMCFKIAMILSSIRSLEANDFSNSLICNDVDFQNALRLIEIFKSHALRVYYELPNIEISKITTEREKELIDKAEQIRLSKKLRDEGKSYSEISRLVLGDPKSKSKIFSWLNVAKI
jgi:Protein of unknown function (DUF3987)